MLLPRGLGDAQGTIARLALRRCESSNWIELFASFLRLRKFESLDLHSLFKRGERDARRGCALALGALKLERRGYLNEMFTS
jgi:hypothetical protein